MPRITAVVGAIMDAVAFSGLLSGLNLVKKWANMSVILQQNVALGSNNIGVECKKNIIF